jgi:hypothetical protein
MAKREWVRSAGLAKYWVGENETDCHTATLSTANPEIHSHCHIVHCKSRNILPLSHCPLKIQTDPSTATLSTEDPEVHSHCQIVHCKSRNTLPLSHCPLKTQKYTSIVTLSTANPEIHSHCHIVHCKSHTDRSGAEPRSPQWRDGESAPEQGAALFTFCTQI